MMLGRRLFLSTSLVLPAAAACDSLREPNVALCVLHDMSGSYFRELGRNIAQIRLLTSTLRAGDQVMIARIDSCSFSNEAIIVPRRRISDTPSRRVGELLALGNELEAFHRTAKRTDFTDIRGALLQALAELRGIKAAKRQVVIFSDLEDDLPRDCRRDALAAIDLRGIDVSAVNVIKLPEDNRDPQRYFARLATWKRLVEGNGGTWSVLSDVAPLVEQLRRRTSA